MLVFTFFLAALFGGGGAIPEEALSEARRLMVAEHLAARDIVDPAVLAAMGRVPRHKFMRPGDEPFAYGDHPYPIGEGQTISQPYIVALMTQLAEIKPGDRVFEVGAGSGYAAAVYAECGAQVFAVELIPELAARARANLDATGYGTVEVRAGDGFAGWPEHAPFQAILLTCAAPRVPEPLIQQLAEGGRLIAPIGDTWQELIRYRKRDGALVAEPGIAVRFVPMRGEIEKPPAK